MSIEALQRHDLDPARAALIRARAHAQLAKHHRRKTERLRATASRLYARALEPALLTSVILASLAWALELVSDLYR